jgi:hypothetical protein
VALKRQENDLRLATEHCDLRATISAAADFRQTRARTRERKPSERGHLKLVLVLQQ